MGNKSILRKLQIAMLAFGIAMGFVFPIYANFFVEWKPNMFIWFFIGCMLAGLTVGLVSFWFVKIILIKKLKQISALALRIQKRDISNAINLKSDDEIGEIVDGLNASIQNIRDLFEEIINVFSISEEILSDIENSEYHKVSAINKINDCITDVVDSTKQMDKQSQEIQVAVNKGENISQLTGTQQLSTINQAQEFAVIIDSLVKRSEKINDILLIIEEIAGETNILAINASVEAARAGEMGKGFTVIATEIKKLATNTSESSQTIAQNIKLLQSDIKKASQSVEIINKEVKRNNVNLNLITEEFANINHTVEEKLINNTKLNQSVNTLTGSFTEVQNIFNELKKNMHKLNSMVSEYKV